MRGRGIDRLKGRDIQMTGTGRHIANAPYRAMLAAKFRVLRVLSKGGRRRSAPGAQQIREGALATGNNGLT
jgi:hypothetical protein